MIEEPNTFYNTLSTYYDVVFPMESIILSYLKDVFKDSSRILDVACGTGTYTIPLWEEGKQIMGVDIDPLMIQQARQKFVHRFASRPSSVPIASEDLPSKLFLTEDMRTLASFSEGTFDGIYCIGNSLPHLSTEEQIRTALKRFRSLLAPRGILLVQIVNFDRVTFYDTPYYDLPTLEGGGVKLVRRYTPGPDPDHVYFETELLAQGSEYSNRFTLYRLTRNRFMRALEEAGFGIASVEGSYDGTPFDPSKSFLLIAKAHPNPHSSSSAMVRSRTGSRT
ncbi:MAG: class I SAM-dependent methyltransferase [Spirochaetes bacterium]|nr:class I SAM-dependent methyltransferase [Spirochaetota bacterium]